MQSSVHQSANKANNACTLKKKNICRYSTSQKFGTTACEY